MKKYWVGDSEWYPVPTPNELDDSADLWIELPEDLLAEYQTTCDAFNDVCDRLKNHADPLMKAAYEERERKHAELMAVHKTESLAKLRALQ